jgi:uncharacterized membrane protein
MSSRRLWLVVLCAVMLGVFFRAYNLDRKTYWEDEMLGTMRMLGYTEAEMVQAAPRLTRAADVQAYLRLPADRTRDRLSNTVTALAAEDPQHPPGYYLLAHLWAEFFGTSPLALRSLPALFGVLLLPCVFWLSLELFESKPIAAVAVALTAVSPIFVLYAQEAREYSLWAVMIALSSVAFLRASRSTGSGSGSGNGNSSGNGSGSGSSNGRGNGNGNGNGNGSAAWSAYCVSLVLGLYVYPLTALLALGHGVFLFFRDGFRWTHATGAYLLSLGVAVAAFAPWVVVTLRVHGLSNGLRGLSGITGAQLSIGSRLSALLHDIRSPFVDLGYMHSGTAWGAVITAALGALACALALYATFALARTQPFCVWGFVLCALCLPLIPLFFYRGFVYQARYFAPLQLAFILAVAALIAPKLSIRAETAKLSILAESAKLGLRDKTVWAAGGWAGPASGGWAALLLLVLAAQTLSCYRSSQADTWWNKDGERSPAVASIVNRADAPLVISRWFVPSVLGLGYYLAPDVPLRVDLKCSNCALALPARRGLLADTGAYREVFVLDPPADVQGRGRYRPIDPRPFPARAAGLTMFQSVSR